MTSINCSGARRLLACIVLALASLPWCWAQSSGVLTIAPPAKATGKRGGFLEAKISVQLRSGYHVNSNTPSEDYLIPLRLTWEPDVLPAPEVTYPKPRMENYSFADKPLSVFTGDFELMSKFKVPANAPQGMNVLVGKLRYQACTDKLCLPPKTVEVRLPITIY